MALVHRIEVDVVTVLRGSWHPRVELLVQIILHEVVHHVELTATRLWFAAVVSCQTAVASDRV